MAVAKLNYSNPVHVKPDEGNDSVDTFIKPSSAREGFYSRASDTPVQWIQLLHALDQQDLPGWPLLTPLKVQMQKCDKCSREFCSSINYRRHMRVHHRWKKLNKDSTKNKDLLGAFWDKLLKDEMKEILSFKDVTLEEVTGFSIVKSLTALIRKPGFSSLPQNCLRAGSALLDIIQDSSSRFPLSSKELFSILDDASEKTFLCGTASSMQKYIFDGEAGKVGLEPKNLVACTGFLLEQKLIKAWLADKDAEALRCQKLLVEEEEATQRRQAELLERKRQKKLRQREQKAKEQRQDEKSDMKEWIDDKREAISQAEQSCCSTGSDAHDLEKLPGHLPLHHESLLPPKKREDVDLEIQTGHAGGSTGIGRNGEKRVVPANSRRHLARWGMPSRSQWNHVPHGFHASQSSQAPKLSTVQKHGIPRDARLVAIVNGNKKWSQKHKPDNEEALQSGAQKEAVNPPDKCKKSEVLIGSIAVSLGGCSYHEGSIMEGVQNDCMEEHLMLKKNSSQEKHNRLDSVQFATNRSIVKIWRPVSQHGMRGTMMVEIDPNEGQVDQVSGKDMCQSLSGDTCQRTSAVDSSGEIRNSSGMLDQILQSGCSRFSSQIVKAFLAERWKATMAAQHVKLVLSTLEPTGCVEVENDCETGGAQSSESEKRSVAGNGEKWAVEVGAEELLTGGAGKGKLRSKPLRGIKLKFTPKQRAGC